MNKEEIIQRIQALESELTVLKEELNKPENFKFKYLSKNCTCIGSSWLSAEMEGTDRDALEYFRYRQTEANAQVDFQLQKELMCIGAIAEQIDPYYKSKINWGNGQPKYYIVFNYYMDKYTRDSSKEWRDLGVVYMPQDVAEKVCEILNNKEVEL